MLKPWLVRLPCLLTLCFKKHMFWHLLPAPVIGGQVHKLPLLSAEEWMDKQLCSTKQRERLGFTKLCLICGSKDHEGEDSGTM